MRRAALQRRSRAWLDKRNRRVPLGLGERGRALWSLLQSVNQGTALEEIDG